MPTTSAAYPYEYFERRDEEDDRLFYAATPALAHVDAPNSAILTAFFQEVFPPNGHFLELMSASNSYLPDLWLPAELIGIGPNSAEMHANPQLSTFDEQDLNLEPILPYEENQFDAVLCNFCIQYLTQPLELFGEINRILKPNGTLITAFSSPYHPEKAIQAWIHSDDKDHIGLVHSYYQLSGNWSNLTVRLKTDGAEPLYILWGQKTPRKTIKR